ncbi:hypothetical protein FA13DRAFT_1391419 [Coprinellus micaceus]|uniref:NACHT domain-containing protein n=1 Tax=Coprinellus micaceus TaxID=71717 RepID=A0A4Y7SQX1_COPMI|nr:hypothetical protein FA13DRAFT_1391419 [Coprinellus micaceus]
MPNAGKRTKSKFTPRGCRQQPRRDPSSGGQDPPGPSDADLISAASSGPLATPGAKTPRTRNHPYLSSSRQAPPKQARNRAEPGVIDAGISLDERVGGLLQDNLPDTQQASPQTRITSLPRFEYNSLSLHTPHSLPTAPIPSSSSSTPSFPSLPVSKASPQSAYTLWPHPEPRASPYGLGQGLPTISSPAISGPSFLANAHDFSIESFTATFAPSMGSSSLFKYLNPHICHGAAHDSSERCTAPQCHGETRVAVRQEIFSWIKDDDGEDEPKRIMWLSGPAGGGKTAIAGSIATACQEEGLLAASFFFSSFSPSPDRSSKRALVATLAHHMSQNDALHQFKSYLLMAIQRHPDVFYKNIHEQAERLILGPFRLIQDQGERKGWPRVVIIDGLDAVVAEQSHDTTGQRISRTSEEDRSQILDVLLALSQNPSFPFRILLASRPEHDIADFFATNTQASTILFLDSKYNPDTDIKLFLEAKFSRIRRRSGISTQWPGQEAIDRIVHMSSGQFIVAVTFLRWVESGVAQQQLDEILRMGSQNFGAKNPFATLDSTYRHILKSARNPDHDPHLIAKWILSIASSMKKGDPHFSKVTIPPVRFWRQFLEDTEGELNYRLEPTSSLISIPSPDVTFSCINIHHRSLTDFLSTEARCGDLYVDEPALNSFLAGRIVKFWKDSGPPAPPSLAGLAVLVEFLRDLHDLELLQPTAQPWGSDVPMYHSFAQFMTSFSQKSKNDLTLCDVGWWSAIYLTGTLPGAPPTSQFQLRKRPKLLGAIYCGIHKVMNCEKLESSPTEHTPTVSRCHAACARWRSGILAQAKTLKWCVHELEQVGVDQLKDITVWEFEEKFKKMGRRQPDGTLSACYRCQPTLSNS